MSHHERSPIRPTAEEERHARLCAYVLGELDTSERDALEAELAASPDLRAERDRLEATIGLVTRALPAGELSPAVRATLRRAAEGAGGRRRLRLLRGGKGLARFAAAALVLIVGGVAARVWWKGDPTAVEGTDFAYSIFGEPSPAPAGDADVALEELAGLGYVASGAGYRGPSDSAAPTAPTAVGKAARAALRGRAAGLPAETDADELSALSEMDAAPASAKAGDRGLRMLQGLGYADGERRTPIAPRLRPDEWIARCTPRPRETPREAFFRCWGEHPFVATPLDPLSTFALDVDTASYVLARRTLRAGRLPAMGQVRTEEFVNYFRPDLPAPTRDDFAIDLELAPSRFGADPDLWMLRVAVRARDVHELDRRPLALTFVVDVSGSMDEPDRLPLVKEALKELIAKLSVTDAVALVAFSNEATVISPMVSAGNARGALEDAVDALRTRGGTNVEAGLRQGFRLAADALTPGAVNRVVFLSDGVGNIGETDQERILAQVEEQRARGIYLNTVGVGLGDHADAFLEQLADRGDGLCDYVDSMGAVRRALIENFTGAFEPIARDVKIQVEFDPSLVREYRQLGYENRALADADFRRDEVDAGEVHAGHQATALYELRLVPGAAASPTPFATVRLRYKPPFAVDAGRLDRSAAARAEVATERERAARPEDAVNTWNGTTFGYRRAVVAAQFAELLRRSVFAREDEPAALLADAEALARESAEADVLELVELIRLAVPLLEADRAAMDAELDRLLRELSELHYRRGQRELLGEEPPSEAELAAETARIAELEEALREHLAGRPAGRRLRPIGYAEEAGER